MRTQMGPGFDVDEGVWRLPAVDPTGWLAQRRARAAEPPAPVAAAGPEPGRRRPRRTRQARLARERDLARRRRRRHGRTLVAEHSTGRGAAVGPVGGLSGRRVSGAAAAEDYRIGRWGRLALTVLVLATLALVGVRLLAGSAAGAAEPVDVTVRPGDTLWSIAAVAAPDRDPREVIDEIRALNAVSGDVVRVGEVLRVPASPDRGSGE